MDASSAGMKTQRKMMPKSLVRIIGVDRVQASQELEWTHEERSGGRTAFRVGQPDIDASRVLIHLDDLSPPAGIGRFIFVHGNRLRGSPVERFDVPGTEGDGSFPGPVELDGMTDLQGEDRVLTVVGDRDDLSAKQTLPSNRGSVFLPDRLGGMLALTTLPL